ncbi:hypothetical protein BaRGS_00021652 [Batillaria attramentaria]|uniref:Uncharacterized protein n=1 Tax=Batillaria attramentaria TaxID=370345 RepID=A0ABD0KJB7_9CAEN
MNTEKECMANGNDVGNVIRRESDQTFSWRILIVHYSLTWQGYSWCSRYSVLAVHEIKFFELCVWSVRKGTSRQCVYVCAECSIGLLDRTSNPSVRRTNNTRTWYITPRDYPVES